VAIIQQALQQSGDFLSLTREHEWSLAENFSFEVVHQGSQTRSLVTVIDTGIICFEPLDGKTEKDIVISCGVHGNETAPIEICADLVKQLILGELYLDQRVLFLFGNPAAMNISERFVEENMNRLFSGAHSQGDVSNKERTRAAQLEKAVADFFTDHSRAEKNSRYHYDLHTAIRESTHEKFAVYPFRHGQPWKKEQLSFLLACGVDTILLSGSPTTTFSYYSSNEFGADAFTVELGKVRPFGENDMASFSQVKQTLTAFVSGQELDLKPYQKEDFYIFEISQIINKHTDNFKLHFADDTKNFTEFALGEVMASDGETQYTANVDGEAIIFPNANVALGQRALLTVKPTQI